MTKKGYRKITKFPPHVKAFIEGALQAGICYTCLSKVLYLEYGIRISWMSIRRYDLERKSLLKGA